MKFFYYFLLLFTCNISNNQSQLCYNETCETVENITEYISTDVPNITTLQDLNETESEQTTEEDLTTTTPIPTTIIASTTTLATTTKQPNKIESHSEESLRDIDNICTCDYYKNSCDINCCCDPDCSYFERQIFKKCQEIPTFNFDSRYCYQSQIIYSNNTKYLMIKNNHGLFCIVKDNIKKQLLYPNRAIIREEKFLEKLIRKKKRYQWNEESYNRELFNSSDYYRIGRPIWSISNNSIVLFQIPSRFGGIFCHSYNTINFLEEKDYSCVLSLDQDLCDKDIIDARTYFLNRSIITNPNLLNISQNFNFSQCTNISCLPIKPFFCQNIYNSSVGNCSEIKVFPKPVFDGYCKNRVEKVAYLLHHNGTRGLTNASVYIWLTNSSSEYYKFKVSVHFIWTQHKKPVFKKSGSPGYRIGAPILAGQKVFQTVGEMDLEAIALSEDPINWLTFPKSNFQGFCDLNQRTLVTFGENRRVACNLNILNKTCEEIHNLAVKLLIGNVEERFVASYGDSSIHMTGDWVPIKQLTPIPSSTNKEKEICLLPLTSLHLDVVWARIGSFYNPQAKIIGVAQRLGTEGILYKTNDPINLVASVNFVEVTRPAKIEFAQLPVYELKLPHDFFYPFFSRTSLASRISLKMFLLFSLVLNFIL